MESLSLETVAALFRASESAVICTRGGRVAFANPAAVRALDRDPTGENAAAIVPERLLGLQGRFGAASMRIQNREAVVTLSGAGLYRAYTIRFLPGPRRMPQLPTPQWTALQNLRLVTEYYLQHSKLVSLEERKYIAKQMICYYQLLRWFENVTTFAGLQEKTLPFQSAETDCAALLRRIVENLRTLAEPRGIQVVTELPEEAKLVADEILVERLVMNLLLNSLISCSAGSRIRLALTLSKDFAAITVQDTGCGIAPERMGTIFDSFDVRPESDRERGGCGLPVVLGIAQLHNGEILVDSTPDLGTTVTVTLSRHIREDTLNTSPPVYRSDDRTRFLSGLADCLIPEDMI